MKTIALEYLSKLFCTYLFALDYCDFDRIKSTESRWWHVANSYVEYKILNWDDVIKMQNEVL